MNILVGDHKSQKNCLIDGLSHVCKKLDITNLKSSKNTKFRKISITHRFSILRLLLAWTGCVGVDRPEADSDARDELRLTRGDRLGDTTSGVVISSSSSFSSESEVSFSLLKIKFSKFLKNIEI